MTEFTAEWIAEQRKIFMNPIGKQWYAVGYEQLILEAFDHIERLQSQIDICHELVDLGIGDHKFGACTRDSRIDFRLIELIAYYKIKEQRIAELEQERRWISVEERLPEEDDFYFVVYRKEYTGRIKPYAQYFSKKLGWTNGSNYITHWQEHPLPPPEGDGE